MCTVISGNCGCGQSTSSGVSAEGVLATGAILAAVAVGGWIFQRTWVLIGVALLAGWICVTPRLRRVTFVASALLVAGGLALGRWAYRRLRRPSRAVALPQPYRAELFVETPTGRRQLLAGPVPGAWTSASDVESEAMRLYVERYGYPTAGTLCCQAQPLT